MSMSEVKRYADALNADWGLRGDAEKYEVSASRKKTLLERAVAFAAAKGYDFTLEEAKKFAKAKGVELNIRVTDADLERFDRFPHAGGLLGIITGDF